MKDKKIESKEDLSNVISKIPLASAVTVRYSEDASTSDAIALTVIPVAVYSTSKEFPSTSTVIGS